MAFERKGIKLPKGIKTQATLLGALYPGMRSTFIKLYMSACREQAGIRVQRNHAIGEAMRGDSDD